MKRILAVILALAALGGGVWAAYTRDITGELRKDDATLTEAVLKAIEYQITVAETGGGGMYIRQDSTATIAKETGGNLAAAATSLAILDDWDETNRCAVNLIPNQVGITAGAGAVAATTPRVTLASNDPAVDALEPTAIAITGNAGSPALADVGSPVAVAGKGRISLTVKNTSDTAITDFALWLIPHATADYVKVLGGTDWATPTSVLRFSGLSATSQTVRTLAAGEVVTIMLDLGAPHTIKVQAACGTASKSITVYGQAMP